MISVRAPQLRVFFIGPEPIESYELTALLAALDIRVEERDVFELPGLKVRHLMVDQDDDEWKPNKWYAIGIMADTNKADVVLVSVDTEPTADEYREYHAGTLRMDPEIPKLFTLTYPTATGPVVTEVTY
jgi:hypothetical protein